MTKIILDTPNYAATVVKVHNLVELENCDNVVGFPIFGLQAIVPRTVQVGDLGIIFTTESQLSEKYTKENNLYRHEYLNSDPTVKGYMEDNRRVKALRFRGMHKSNALFMPLDSLKGFGDISELKEGDTFNFLNGEEVCKKYVNPRTIGRGNHVAGKLKKFERIDNKTFPEHLDSDNYFRNIPMYHPNDLVIVTQKLHGTSGRFGYVKVRRKLSWFENLLKKLGIKINETEYDYIAGSRRVIKDAKAEKEYNHYYSSDVWNEVLERVKDLLPKDLILYGEIIGRSGEKPIQKNYTYNYPKGENDLFIYRIAVVNEDGYSTDLSWPAVVEFCKNTGLKAVPTFETMKHEEFNPDYYMDKNFGEMYPQAVRLDPSSPCDEGVCLRREGLLPYITKAKSPTFLEHETKMLDSGEVDIETEESSTETLPANEDAGA